VSEEKVHSRTLIYRKFSVLFSGRDQIVIVGQSDQTFFRQPNAGNYWHLCVVQSHKLNKEAVWTEFSQCKFMSEITMALGAQQRDRPSP
jgi:hypothetical protein